MLSKAVAIEAGKIFINISISSITSKWFGEGEKYVKAIFSLAIKISPSVIFVDELTICWVEGRVLENTRPCLR